MWTLCLLQYSTRAAWEVATRGLYRIFRNRSGCYYIKWTDLIDMGLVFAELQNFFKMRDLIVAYSWHKILFIGIRLFCIDFLPIALASPVSWKCSKHCQASFLSSSELGGEWIRRRSMYSTSSSDRIFLTPFLQSLKFGSSSGLRTLVTVGILVVMNISFRKSFLSGSKVFNALAIDL